MHGLCFSVLALFVHPPVYYLILRMCLHVHCVANLILPTSHAAGRAKWNVPMHGHLVRGHASPKNVT